MVLDINKLFLGTGGIKVDGAVAYTKSPKQKSMNELWKEAERSGKPVEGSCGDGFWQCPENEYYISPGESDKIVHIVQENWNGYTCSFQYTGPDMVFYSDQLLSEGHDVAKYHEKELEYSYVCNSNEKGVLVKIIEFSQKKCFVSSGALSGCLVCEIVFPKFYKSLFFHVGAASKKYPLEEKCRDLWNGILCMLPKLNQQNELNIPGITRAEKAMSISELNERIVQMINNKNVYDAMGYMNVNLLYRGEEKILVEFPVQSSTGKYTIMNYPAGVNGMLLSTYYRKNFSSFFMKNQGRGTPYYEVNKINYEPNENPPRKKKKECVIV